MKEEEDIVYCLARNLTTRQIMLCLLEHKLPMTNHEIASKLKKTEITVQRKLTRLVQAQIVCVVDEGLIAKYRLNKENCPALEKLLDMYKKKWADYIVLISFFQKLSHRSNHYMTT